MGSCTPGLNYCYDTLVKYNYDPAKLKEAVDLLNQPSLPANKIKLHCNDDQSVTGPVIAISAFEQ
ncbi:hypothetical protein E4U33_000999 [Claviceps sp. LM78 group G4]|nr:hypothetical protein E4U33_000999 [Claviceps sp. LM78 group G4]